MSAPSAALGQLPQELTACLPLVVGVTGHRDLDGSDQARTKAALRQVLNDLRIRFPNTNVMLISALAPGADQLAAEVALNEGAYLAAALPMPADIYVTTFEGNGGGPENDALARDQFAALRKQALLELEIPLAEGVTRELLTDSDPATREKAQQSQYAALAVSLTRWCQVVIALWDGAPSSRPGGTAHVVKLQTEGHTWPDTEGGSEEPGGLVYHIPVRRKGDARPIADCGAIRMAPKYLWKQDPQGTLFDRTFERIDLFNQDVRALKALWELSPGPLHPWRSEYPSLRFLSDWELRADRLAGHFQGKTRQALVRLYCLAFLAFVCFEVQAHLLQGLPELLLLYPAAAFAAHRFLSGALRDQLEKRYLDYRSVAEALRVQFYWTMAGLNASVADYYLCRQRSELDWLRIFLRYSRLFVPGLPPEGLEARLQQVRELWVEGQHAFFSKRLAKMNSSQLRTNRLTRWLIRLALFVAGAMGVSLTVLRDAPSFRGADEWVHAHGWVHGVGILLIGLPSIIAGLLHSYAEREGFKEHARQSREMEFLYSRASEHLSAALGAKDFGRAQRIVFELGREALEENAEWLILHRERPLSVPE